jgi:NAD(P)-dependent dehydrogenase (short-subunit alcohol dehydrogenase family)
MGALQDRVALVTGAGAGLGRAVALGLARAGARVVAVSLHASELDEVRATAAAEILALDVVAADVGDALQAEAVAADVLARHGRLDVLVNNAGIIAVKPIEDTTPAEWDKIVATNLRGPFLYSRAFIPAMKARGDGLIVNVTSESGIRGFVGESAYCPSKFGLEGLTRTLALELEPFGIRVVSVTPGKAMHTPMSETTYDAAARAEWVDPSELAPGFVALAESHDPGISGGRYDAWQLARDGLA